jgi:hypothetical protein
MILNGKKYRVGSWAEPYVEELLAGFHIHNPTYYLGRSIMEGKVLGKMNEAGKPMRVSFLGSYRASWNNVLVNLNKAGIDVITIAHPQYGNEIYILEKHFRAFLKNRKIDRWNGYRLYKIEDRVLLFKNKRKYDPHPSYILETRINIDERTKARALDYGMFKVYPAKYKKISDILVEETLEQLDLKEAS